MSEEYKDSTPYNKQWDEEDENEVAEQAGDEETDAGSDEEPAQLIQEIAFHPAIQRQNEQMLEHARKTFERLQEDLRQQKVAYQSLERQWEDLGVEKYNVQQQLAHLEIQLRQAHDEHNQLKNIRLELEDQMEREKAGYEEQKAVVTDYRKQVLKHQSELNALQDTLRQVEIYNQEMQAEIQISRRATYKTEQSMQELEKNKLRQDLYIDTLSATLNKLNEQIAQYNKQMEAQRRETKDAEDVLRETEHELELIQREKNQLMQEWNSSLEGLKRRDEALAQATMQLREAEAAVKDFDTQLDAVKRSTVKEQEYNETIVQAKDKAETKLKSVREQLAKLRQDLIAMRERSSVLQQSLQSTQQEDTKLLLTKKQLSDKMKHVLTDIQLVTQHRQKYEEAIAVSKSTRATVGKQMRDLSKQQSTVIRSIHESERKEAEAENTLARLRIEVLGVQTVIGRLREQLAERNNEVKATEETVNRYSTEIQQRQDQINRKERHVEQLNKDLTDLNARTSAGEDVENLGECEAKIKNLQKEIDTVDTQCGEMERRWLDSQRQLVNATHSIEKFVESSTESKARITVLTQQQLRLAREIEQATLDVKSTNANTAALRKDMDKLNALIAEFTNEAAELERENAVLEIKCKETIEAWKQESKARKGEIESAEQDNKELEELILRQTENVANWQKRLQIDEETRRIFDPSVGQDEVAEMEREIQRMGIRLTSLRKEQQRLGVELERSMERHGKLFEQQLHEKTARHTTRNNESKEALSKAALRRQSQKLQREANADLEKSNRLKQAIEEKNKLKAEVESELIQATDSLQQAEDTLDALQSSIYGFKDQERQVRRIAAAKKALLGRLSQVLEAGNHEELENAAIDIERRLLAKSTHMEKLKGVLDDVQNTHTGVDFSDVLKLIDNFVL